MRRDPWSEYAVDLCPADPEKTPAPLTRSEVEAGEFSADYEQARRELMLLLDSRDSWREQAAWQVLSIRQLARLAATVRDAKTDLEKLMAASVLVHGVMQLAEAVKGQSTVRVVK